MDNYTYKAQDKQLEGWGRHFESRIGDNSGAHDCDYFDMIKLLLSLKRQGSLLDIGAGVGRVTLFAKDMIGETVALEPDQERWKKCFDAYHEAPKCQVLCQMTSEFIKDNPCKTFDVIVIGMVIQHISTNACQALLAEAATLLKPDGVCIVSTSHAIEASKGFSYAGAVQPDEFFISKEAFNDYAENPSTHTIEKGIPVHRFSKDELLGYLKPHFDIIYWRQFSYYRKESQEFFANRLQLDAPELEGVGNTQFVVVQKQL